MELYRDIKELHAITQDRYTQAELKGDYENMQKYGHKIIELEEILDRYN